MLNKSIKTVATMIGFLLGNLLVTLIEENSLVEEHLSMAKENFTVKLLVYFGIILIVSSFFYFSSYVFVTRVHQISKKTEKEINKVQKHKVLSSTIGVILGFLLSFMISPIMNNQIFSEPSTQLIILLIIYTSFAIIGSKLGEFFLSDYFKSKLPQIDKDGNYIDRERRRDLANKKVVDTSVIIDGRIVDIMKTGFIEGQLLLPDFVLQELRHIADSDDDTRRVRGRRGLDILKEMQTQFKDLVRIIDEPIVEEKEVDAKLIKLAKNKNCSILTNDFNLNKVAKIKGVKVLNINDLANSLRPILLPGEKLETKIIKQGKGENQGLAYLDDGTMIVVENASHLINSELSVEVTSVLQTSAGKMIFAKIC